MRHEPNCDQGLWAIGGAFAFRRLLIGRKDAYIFDPNDLALRDNRL